MIIDPDFLEHWRTQMLSDLLGGDPLAPVYLIRLWSHCQSRRSVAFEIPAAGLKALCRYQGDADQFESAMIESGFVERDGGGISVLKWAEHNSQLISSWKNGKSGGRPKKTQPKPSGNPAVTQPKPKQNPAETQGAENPGKTESGLTDKRREEEIREDLICSPTESLSDKPGKPPDGDTPEQVVEAWNKIDGVIPCQRLTTKRRKAIATRLKDAWWRDNWRSAIQKIPSQGFLLGQNDSGWTASIDFFVRPESITKILEGQYPGRSRAGPASTQKPGVHFHDPEAARKADPNYGKF